MSGVLHRRFGCTGFYHLRHADIGGTFLAFSVRVQLVLPLALLVTLVIHAAFYKGLRVPLPWGILQPLQW